MQWLRRERLELARYQLEHAHPDDSVCGIARRCGYRSPSHFSTDFQRRFHCKPSELLREGGTSAAGEATPRPLIQPALASHSTAMVSGRKRLKTSTPSRTGRSR